MTSAQIVIIDAPVVADISKEELLAAVPSGLHLKWVVENNHRSSKAEGVTIVVMCNDYEIGAVAVCSEEQITQSCIFATRNLEKVDGNLLHRETLRMLNSIKEEHRLDPKIVINKRAYATWEVSIYDGLYLNVFSSTIDPEEGVLDIAAIHPRHNQDIGGFVVYLGGKGGEMGMFITNPESSWERAAAYSFELYVEGMQEYEEDRHSRYDMQESSRLMLDLVSVGKEAFNFIKAEFKRCEMEEPGITFLVPIAGTSAWAHVSYKTARLLLKEKVLHQLFKSLLHKNTFYLTPKKVDFNDY